MATINPEKAFWQDRSTSFWSLISIGVVSLCFGILLCGLVAGAGTVSVLNALNQPEQAHNTISLGSGVNLAAEAQPDDTTTQAPAAETLIEETEDKATSSDTNLAETTEVTLGITDKNPQPPKTGNPAANFTLETLDGDIVSLADFAGQPIIINFWATWCGPCEAEMPDINAAYLAHKDEGLIVLAVDMAEHPETVRSFVKYYDLAFHILIDADQIVGRHYGARALPTTYFIDRSGNIVHMYFGQMRESDIEVGLRKILPQQP